MDGRALRVFISYARSDASAFAEDLLRGLEVAGFYPFLDRHDIARRARIGWRGWARGKRRKVQSSRPVSMRRQSS